MDVVGLVISGVLLIAGLLTLGHYFVANSSPEELQQMGISLKQ